MLAENARDRHERAGDGNKDEAVSQSTFVCLSTVEGKFLNTYSQLAFSVKNDNLD